MELKIKGSTRVTIGAIGIGGSGIGIVGTLFGAISDIWIPILMLAVSLVVYENGLSKHPPS